MILRLGDIKINLEFENLIPKLTQDQFTQLEENMVKDGRARNPLVTWKGHDILVDGHNRLRILKAHPELGWTYVEQEFADEEEAKEWIIKNCLGTRNLTEMQITELRGRLYKTRKGRRGATKGNARAERGESGKFTVKSEKPTSRSSDVATSIAKDLGIDRTTVYAAANFVDGLDAADAAAPGTSDKVRTGELKPSKAEVRSWREKTPEEIKESIAEIEERKSKKRRSADRVLAEKIRNVDAAMSSVSTTKYGLNELLREIDALGDTFLLSLDSIIKRRSSVISSYDGGAAKVLEHIELIENKINDMKKGL